MDSDQPETSNQKPTFNFYFTDHKAPFWPADSETWESWGDAKSHPEMLPLSDETLAEIERLSLWHDSFIYWSDPGSGIMWDREENERFLTAARNLYHRVHAELGDEFELIDRLDLNDYFTERPERPPTSRGSRTSVARTSGSQVRKTSKSVVNDINAYSHHHPLVRYEVQQTSMGSSTKRAKDSARAQGLTPGTTAYNLRVFLDLVRFEHTIFALPFAYIGMVLAADGLPTLWDFIWVSVAMAAARTLAFAVNRLADRTLDATNPRTANRPTVTGAIQARTVLLYAGVAVIVLLIAAALLDPLALQLAPLAILFLVGYSFMKRFTVLAHWVLGFTDALAVGGGWIAVRGSFFGPDDLPAWLLIGAVTFWIAGFDLIYACQDYDHDIREGLHAWPARHGIASALFLARLNHVAFLLFLAAAGLAAGLAWPYYLAGLVTLGMLVYEHSIVAPDDLSRVNVAFFNMNSYIALTLLIGTFVAVIL